MNSEEDVRIRGQRERKDIQQKEKKEKNGETYLVDDGHHDGCTTVCQDGEDWLR